ncbi:hypothetical protein [Larkinella humicola]|uniref:Uncharacterized protein n=1 Tax=Larkinella humicola TaxID=2607654 RepID=A0A5N1JEK7_9BACT|nr:hypothetical protein [Larkinella humicola]KAA9353472.1 hypothetical protein F0P93_12555 [Larkinella humicola]
MKRMLILGLFVVGLTPVASAQGVFLTDVNGQVLRASKYVDVQGSPYLNEAWKEGAVITAGNKTYPNLKVRYDVFAGELEYLQNNQTYRLSPAAIKEFRIMDNDELLFRNGFAAVNANTPATFYQVLVDGPTKLLKHTKVNIVENKPFNSATVTKEFQKQELYFIAKPDGTMQRIQKNKKSVLAALTDQKDRVEKLIKEQDLNLSEENNLITLLESYNAK